MSERQRRHIVDGKFQSDKYPACPAGKVPLSVKDPQAQPLLWAYAEGHHKKDAEFADDLKFALLAAGYERQPHHEWPIPTIKRNDRWILGDDPVFAELTPREHEVGHYLIVGWDHHQIASVWGLSIKTIDTHRGHIMKKLKVRNNVELLRLVISKGGWR